MVPMPLISALRFVNSNARSFTSSAHTSAFGDSNAIVNAIGPQPQPKSRNVPSCAGSGTLFNSTEVPRSNRLPENTPLETSTSAVWSRSMMCSLLRTSSDVGSAAKYCSALPPCPPIFVFVMPLPIRSMRSRGHVRPIANAAGSCLYTMMIIGGIIV